jgi:16S rRNA G1207 methylase RsmC
MDLAMVGQMMNQQAKIDTLEKVNVSLIKSTNTQAEQQVAQLLDSVALDTTIVEGNKGKNINLSV